MGANPVPGQITAANPKDILTGTGILIFFGAATLYFPVFGFIFFLLMPLPVAFYRVKFGRSPSGTMTVAALVVIWLIGRATAMDLWLMLCMTGLGFALGEALERDLSIEETIAYPCAAVLAAAAAALVVSGGISDTGPLELISGYVEKNIEMTAAAYEETGVQDKRIQMLIDSPERIHYVLMRIMPALAVSGLLFSAWVNMLMARIVLPALNAGRTGFSRLNRWKAPDNLVWAAIGCALLVMAAKNPVSFIGINGLIILMMIYLFQGLAVVSFYFETRRVPMFLRIIIYSLLVIQQIFALVVAGLGFFDTWADFRRLGAEGGGNGEAS
ncbi:MAG: YybS family protein [Desulfosalsimonas sp.]